MGEPIGYTNVNQTSLAYTATKSAFTQNVNGNVQIVANFISPITPDDYSRQSLISSYLEIQVSSLDGNDHTVELYTDVTAGTVAKVIN